MKWVIFVALDVVKALPPEVAAVAPLPAIGRRKG